MIKNLNKESPKESGIYYTIAYPYGVNDTSGNLKEEFKIPRFSIIRAKYDKDSDNWSTINSYDNLWIFKPSLNDSIKYWWEN